MSASSALDEHLAKLFRARPELRLAMPYLDAEADAARLAFACLEQEWIDCVYTVQDPSVAAAKLRWWAGELAQAHAGHTHHPLAAALFEGSRAAQLDPAAWQAAAEAGLALREQPPAADFAAQVEAAESFHGAVAALETRLWFGDPAACARAARVAALGHLVSSLPYLGRGGVDNDVLPMQRLARHALDRPGLARDTPARRGALADQLADLQSAFADAMYLPGPLTLFRDIGRLADQGQIRQALRARRPLDVLTRPRGRLGPAMAFRAWRAGRRHRTVTSQ